MAELICLLVALVLFAPAFRATASSKPSGPPTASEPVVGLIAVDGAINPASSDFISDSIARAARDHADALVIELDTPGGLLTSTRAIVKAILNSPIPIIVYVAPSGAVAASAGTFVTEAANIAAMAPGTTIGAAHPVESNGADVPGVMGEKIENFTASFAKSIAHERGRNEAWVESAVRKSSAVSDAEALKLHVIDIVAPDLRGLLRQASGRTVTLPSERKVTLELADAAVHRYEMRYGESLLNRLADPNLMYILMIGGLIGLYFEFAHPGVFLPGVAGAICLLLALTSFEVIPINIGGLLLILLGVGLLISEVFVTSYGVLGLGGIAAFLIGSFLLIDRAETSVAIDPAIIFGAAGTMGTIILGIGYIAFKERRSRAKTGQEGLIGQVGLVRDAIAPDAPGRVFLHGEIWRASSAEPIAAGARVRVMAVRGLELVVNPAAASDAQSTSGPREQAALRIENSQSMR